MRLSILFLLVFNLSVFAWFQFQKSQVHDKSVDDKGYDLAQLPSLTLKSELSDKDLEQRDSRKRTDDSAKRVESQSSAELVGNCLLLGPYGEVVTARSHRHVLANAGVKSDIVEVTSELEALYWVYIGPFSGESDAIAHLKRLHKDNIDSYLVTTGEYKNAISLGVYSIEASADKVLNQQLAAGYPAKKIRRGKVLKSFWLAVGDQSIDNISADLLQKLKKENISLKKQEKSCNSVALLPRIL